jgi:ABC-type spermidine/putrescine transport system permease subunit I
MAQATRKTFFLLVAPSAVLLAFFILPLGVAVITSFEFPHPTLRHYQRLVSVPVYQTVYLKTLRIAFTTTLISLLLAYPCAFYIARLSAKARTIAVLLITVPFMLSVLVRNYVWIVLLQDTGLFNRILLGSGLSSAPVRLMYNELGVTIAMVNMLVPYILFPSLSALLAIPRDLELASSSLGASGVQTFLSVTAPLSASGAAAGCLLTFIVSLGFYVTPAMLGGTREMMISNLIAFNVRELLNWPLAFSLATTLLASTIVLYLIYSLLVPSSTAIRAV